MHPCTRGSRPTTLRGLHRRRGLPRWTPPQAQHPTNTQVEAEPQVDPCPHYNPSSPEAGPPPPTACHEAHQDLSPRCPFLSVTSFCPPSSPVQPGSVDCISTAANTTRAARRKTCCVAPAVIDSLNLSLLAVFLPSGTTATESPRASWSARLGGTGLLIVRGSIGTSGERLVWRHPGAHCRPTASPTSRNRSKR